MYPYDLKVRRAASASGVCVFALLWCFLLSAFRFQAEWATKVASLLEEGLIVHSDCSGKLSPEATLKLLEFSFEQCGIHLQSGWLVS